MNFEKFLEGVEKGRIVYDIRIGIYKTGKNKKLMIMVRHNKKNKIEEFFDVEELEYNNIFIIPTNFSY